MQNVLGRYHSIKGSVSRSKIKVRLVSFFPNETNPFYWQISENLSVGRPSKTLNLENCQRGISVFLLLRSVA